MRELTLRLLGSPEILQTGDRVKFATRKVQALLIYLVVAGGWHSREQLMALFWPESDPPLARAALRNTLARLRQAVGNDDLLRSDGDRIRIAPEVYTSDLRTLDQAFHQSNFDLASTAKALVGVQGEFLEGFTLTDAPAFDEWVSMQREYWHQRVTTLFARCCQHQAEHADLPGAIQCALRWLAYDRLNEQVYVQLMIFYLATGDREAALRIYHNGKTVLETELGLPVSSVLTTLAEQATGRAPAMAPIMRQTPAATAPTAQPKPYAALLDLPLLGRIAEFEQLQQSFTLVQQGDPQVMVLEGEAGMGKSRLATAFLAWAAQQGADIVQGRAFETGGRLPYQPINEALHHRLERENAPDDLLADLWLAELSRLLPDLRDRYPDLPLPLAVGEAEAQVRLFEAVARLGQALATQTPLLVLIDDLQWCDPSSLDLLHFVAHRWARAEAPSAVLLLFTVRSEALTPNASLNEWLGRLRRDVPVGRLSLRPFAPSTLTELVQWLIGEAASAPALTGFSQWLFGETQGQPLFVVETLKALLEEHQLAVKPSPTGRWVLDLTTVARPSIATPLLPNGIRQVIHGRLARLSPEANSLLTAAAVLGQRLSYERLVAVAGINELSGLTALDELLNARLLIEQPQTTTWSEQPYLFSHDKIRDVVYAEAGAARRRVFHRRAFDLLQQTNAFPSELSHHARYAGLLEPAFRYSLLAGNAALRLFAVREALLHYQQAQALWPDLAGTGITLLPVFVELQLQLGRTYELTNEFVQAHAIYTELLSVARQHQLAGAQCAALNRLATLLSAHGAAPAESEALLLQARQLATTTCDQAGLAETVWNMAQLRVYHSAPDALAYSEQALALAREAAVPTLIARSLTAIAHSYTHLGRWDAVIPVAEEARQLYASWGDRALEVEQLCLLTLQYNNLGQLIESVACGRQALTLAQQTDNQWGEAYAAFALSMTLVDTGSVAEALALAQQGIKLVVPLNVPPLHIVNLIALGNAQLAAGDPAAAQASLTEAQQLNFLSGGMRDNAELLANLRCQVALLQGDWENAYTFARQALARRDYDGSLSAGMARWCEVAALIRYGDLDLARQDLANTSPNLARSPRLRLAWLWAAAYLARTDREEAAAQSMLQEALRLAETLGLPREQEQLELLLKNDR